MSGFGGFGQQPNQFGFGTSQTSNQSTQPSFGFNSQQNNEVAPTSSFGAPAAGFGQSPIVGGFGGTYNAQSQSPFGGSNQQQQSFGFNNSAPAATFTSVKGFSSFGEATASTAGFGSTPSATFGNAPTPSTPFAASSTGAASTAIAPFGSSPVPSSGFGSGDNTGFGGFGSRNTNTGSMSANAQSNSSTGFGGDNAETAASALMAFGSSAVAFGSSSTANSDTGLGGNKAETPARSAPLAFGSSAVAFGSSSTTTATSAPTGFGQSNNTTMTNKTAFGFGSALSSEENKSTFGFGSSTTSTTPFGKLAQTQPQNDDSTGNTAGMSTPFGRIPRKERRTDSTKSSMDVPLAASRSDEVGDEQLAALRAKIQEKKNRLLKIKKGNQNGNSNSSEDKSATDSDAKASLSNSELAAKNALRFASNNQAQTTSRLLPTDLQGRSNEVPSSSNGHEGGFVAEEDDDIDEIRTLSAAKDLIGVCRTMCPDEELLRREREGDIQLLEITDPGGIHPQDWTLRDTAVKRFRRSAADFKLDIPELVRPPEVLERVCGYLEEWVMERDRQGPDKRFAQQPSIVPPSLDVYQFIWDRTRMIRKDFILQNYIGDGGKCDARAVRCHERIARWHAMCEHQLSHIQEFVTHQSQQNIAELGQTMKTLNLYYDDALGRAKEEIGGTEEYQQGCASDIVMGKSPVDFDGSELSNTASSDDVSKRIIGANGLNSPTRGTAEPEMRGLYILLTMNNEGGMEVIKYSGRLCTQARKDHNYAKFFHLLRSPSTPYLFSCIMFKYVEQMRKTALMIMSRTYGAKHKTTGESFYDEYPLDNLVKLLCYEDKEEARAACAHYGITLEGSIIRWRNSKFTEPRDPVKNIILNLKPKKMIRTIECKLLGATRLSVCRGGVSGEGATLSGSTGIAASSDSLTSTLNAKEVAEQAKKEALEKARQKKLLEKLKKEEARRKVEARRAEEEAERQRLEAAKQLELERQQEALEEKKRVEMKRQEELRIKKEVEEALLKEARERETALKRAEEEKRELERQRLLEKQRQEDEQKKRLEEEARQRAEAEEKARRQEEQKRKQRIAYELEQKRLAAEESRRKAAEEEERKWLEKVQSAQKLLLWTLWGKQMQKRRRIDSAVLLEKIDPTITSCSGLTSLSLPSAVYNYQACGTIEDHPQCLENKLYQLATVTRERCKLPQILADRYWESSIFSMVSSSAVTSTQPLLLFKLSVVLPQRTPDNENIVRSLEAWADSHLQFQRVTQCTSYDRYKYRSVKVRAVATIGNSDANLCNDCDAALFLLPSIESAASAIFSSEILSSLPENAPKMMMLVGDSINYNNNLSHAVNSVFGTGCESTVTPLAHPGVVIPAYDQLDISFRSCCEALIANSLEKATRQPLIRVSLSKLTFICVRQLLINLSSYGSLCRFQSPVDVFQDLYDQSTHALTIMVNELTNLYEEITTNKMPVWPAKEFMSRRSRSVDNYFDDQSDLPYDWHLSLENLTLIEDKVFGCFQYLFTPESFTPYVINIANKLTDSDRKRLLLRMVDEGNVAGCFVEIVSLVVSGEINSDYEEMPTIYLPLEKMLDIIETAGNCNAPARSRTLKLADVPDFLYVDQLCLDMVEAPTSVSERAGAIVGATATKGVVGSINTPTTHKRKPLDGVTTAPSSSVTKRIKMSGPVNKIESDEVQSSKDFTSYLEALLG